MSTAPLEMEEPAAKQRKKEQKQVYVPKISKPRGSFSIKWSMTSSLRDRLSLEDVGIDFWHGSLMFYDYSSNDDEENDTEIGHIRATKIATIDLLSPEDYNYVFDAHSADLASFAKLFDDESGDVKADVRNEVGEAWEIVLWI